MQFRIEHVIPGIEPAAYERLYFDEPFSIALCREVRLGRELVRHESDARHVRRDLRCFPEGRSIPRPVAAVLGTDRVSYVEQLEYTWGSYEARFRTVSDILTDAVESYGTVSFVAVPEGTKRIVEGVVNVHLFAVGSIIERIVVADAEKSYAQAAEFTVRWLAEHPLARAS